MFHIRKNVSCCTVRLSRYPAQCCSFCGEEARDAEADLLPDGTGRLLAPVAFRG